jgi:hypothetical protein
VRPLDQQSGHLGCDALPFVAGKVKYAISTQPAMGGDLNAHVPTASSWRIAR